MNILITGGLGFIGSNLARNCVAGGHSVTIIARNLIKQYNIRDIKDNINIIVKDVMDIDEEVKGMDIIYHCASTVDNYNILDKPFLDVDVNCKGTIALLEACKKHNTNVKIVYTSTFFVNGNPSSIPVNEDQRENPLGIYGATKLATEHILKTYNSVYGIKSVIARLSNVYGLGEQYDNNKKAAFNRMIHLAVHNKTIKLYDNGKIVRDYIYVDDVVDALVTLADKGQEGQVYFVGTGEGHSFREMVDIILEESRTGNVEVIEPPKFHKSVGIDDFVCDISKIKKLGWNPKIDIRSGIKKVVNIYQTWMYNAE